VLLDGFWAKSGELCRGRMTSWAVDAGAGDRYEKDGRTFHVKSWVAFVSKDRCCRCRSLDRTKLRSSARRARSRSSTHLIGEQALRNCRETASGGPLPG